MSFKVREAQYWVCVPSEETDEWFQLDRESVGSGGKFPLSFQIEANDDDPMVRWLRQMAECQSAGTLTEMLIVSFKYDISIPDEVCWIKVSVQITDIGKYITGRLLKKGRPVKGGTWCPQERTYTAPK